MGDEALLGTLAGLPRLQELHLASCLLGVRLAQLPLAPGVALKVRCGGCGGCWAWAGQAGWVGKKRGGSASFVGQALQNPC